MIHKNSKYDTEEFEKAFSDALRIVNAVGYPETTRQMNDDREEIRMRIEQKINAGKVIKHKSNIHYRNICAAAVALLVIFSTAYAAYRLGVRSSDERVSLQNNIEITAPYGIIARIILPDSSIVTLNGGSTLTYPAVFENGRRQVRLSGEGFFDVAKNSAPFTVHAAHISAEALGTRFGLKAYYDDPYTVLTLEEGCIKAIPAGENPDGGILLKPEQQLILNNETGAIRRQTVNVEEYTSWKDGVLTFRDLTWNEIAAILERRFNVEIRIASDKIRNERYFALFKYGENIEQILDKLSYKRPWKYVKRENMIEITEN